MNGELSKGLAKLAARGNRIVEVNSGRPVLLRGVNRSGLEYSVPNAAGFAAGAGITAEEIRWIAREWNANIFRIPFNQDWVLHGRGTFSGEDYLNDLDRVIEWAASEGSYTLLDLQWTGADTPRGPGNMMVPPLPDLNTRELWRILSARYRQEPAVLFDLFNEPHTRLREDPFVLLRPDGTQYPADHYAVSMTEWRPWAMDLIRTIRGGHPDALIFVSGTDWAYDLRGFPLDSPNLVYSTHVYRAKGRNWEAAFGFLSRFVPVFAGEFGGHDADLGWGAKLLHFLDAREMGWTAWSWSDDPHLARNGAATPFGTVVHSALRRRHTH